jgi:hypothetical protein
MLIMDSSGSMAGSHEVRMKQSATNLVRAFDPAGHPGTRIALVESGERTILRCPLTNDEDQVLRCIDRLQNSGGPGRLDEGIDRAVEVLAARAGDVAPRHPTEILVVYSDGRNNAGCDPVRRAARSARARGALLVTLGLGYDVDQECLRSVASSSGHYCDLNVSGCGALLKDLVRLGPARLVVTDTLSADVWFVTGSAKPDPWYSASGVKAWQFDLHDDTWVTMSLRVRPWISGVVRTNEGAQGTLFDAGHASASWAFPDPEVTVLEPSPGAPFATATEPAWPTATATVTATPTDAAPAQATSTGLTPAGPGLFVPRADR